PPFRRLPEGGEGAFWLWALKPGAATAAPGFAFSPRPGRAVLGAVLIVVIHSFRQSTTRHAARRGL
ncbi:TPA: hypothetical protein ACKRMU_001484, partial [Pseudomonas aeruginosa]